jgi:hypothetical protein
MVTLKAQFLVPVRVPVPVRVLVLVLVLVLVYEKYIKKPPRDGAVKQNKTKQQD